MKRSMDWNGVSFEERIVFLFRTQQTAGEEFKVYLSIFGRERLEALWKKFVREHNERKNQREPGDED